MFTRRIKVGRRVLNAPSEVLLMLIGCIWVLLSFAQFHLVFLPTSNNGLSISTSDVVRRLVSSADLTSSLRKIRGSAASNNANSRKRYRAAAADGNDQGFSACLLVNDENARLNEWIAYHHLMLPLRQLIVAVDPNSRTSPRKLLSRWNESSLNITTYLWHDRDYLPRRYRGAWSSSDSEEDEEERLRLHRKRQNVFMSKCLREWKARNKTWVLLTDVDEYILFNSVHDDDPFTERFPKPEEGIPILTNWSIQADRSLTGILVRGSSSEESRSGEYFVTDVIDRQVEVEDYLIVTDRSGASYYLDDENTETQFNMQYRPIAGAPEGIPTITEWFFTPGYSVGGYINGSIIETEDVVYPDWDNIPQDFVGGVVINDTAGKKYFLENVEPLMSKTLPRGRALAVRSMLPRVGDGITISQVLDDLKPNDGPCIAFPRVLFGSRQDDTTTTTAASQQKHVVPGLSHDDFLTQRYRKHQSSSDAIVKWYKTMIDVSRIPWEHIGKEVENVHRPLYYFCPNGNWPPYDEAIFRLNHYLDSWEAYSYRNDARSNRKCRECYEEKIPEPGYDDDEIRPWLQKFVDEVGSERASHVLQGSGQFV